MIHLGTMKMLSDLMAPQALERLLSDGARARNTTLLALDAATLREILKRDVYARLQQSIPASLAKRRLLEVLDSLDQVEVQESIAAFGVQIQALEDQARQFALYFDWPETQRLRAVLSVARQTVAEGHGVDVFLQEGAELLGTLERKLSEALVIQGQDLSELKASMVRVAGVGGPKIRRLDALIKQISAAQDDRVLLPAEVERALTLVLTLRKQVESSVVQQLTADQQRETVPGVTVDGLPGDGSGEVQPFDLSLLPQEAQVRVQTLEREHETRALSELAREYAPLFQVDAAFGREVEAYREQSGAGELLGEVRLADLRARLTAAKVEAVHVQQGQLDVLVSRLAEVRDGSRDLSEAAVQRARQGLALVRQTLEAGALATDELMHVGQLVRTLATGDAVVRERLMDLQRETFELERRAREVPGASGDLAPLIASAQDGLTAGRVVDLGSLWAILERRTQEAVQERAAMDLRSERVMEDYNRYRQLAGETIQKLGRLVDVLRGQRGLGVLSSDARRRYLQTLEDAEALLTEAHAEFQAARDVTARFGADALSDLLGLFDFDV